MKKTFYLILFCSTALIMYPNISWAQKIDYNHIILPDNALEIEVEEKLVQLAWRNNPSTIILNNNTQLAKLNVRRTELTWLDKVRISANVNEFVIDPARDIYNRSEFYPLYNVSVGVTLGDLFIKPNQTRAAKIEYNSEVESVNAQKLKLRAEVIRLYNNYLLNKELYTIRTEVAENMYNTFLLVEERFKKGEASINEYNSSYGMYKDEQARKAIAYNNLKLAIVNIEEIIGIPLDNVLMNNTQ